MLPNYDCNRLLQICSDALNLEGPALNKMVERFFAFAGRDPRPQHLLIHSFPASGSAVSVRCHWQTCLGHDQTCLGYQTKRLLTPCTNRSRLYRQVQCETQT